MGIWKNKEREYADFLTVQQVISKLKELNLDHGVE